MTDFSGILNTQLILLCLILTGVLLTKIGLVNEKLNQGLSSLVINVFLPCNIFTVFLVEEYDHSLTRYFLLAMGIGFAVETLLYFLSKFLFIRVKDDRGPILRYATLSPNSGFVGIPVISGFYGQGGLLYLSAFLIPLYFYMWGFGLSFFIKTRFRDILKKLATSPALIAIILGFVLMVTGLRPPEFLDGALRGLGACTTPLSLVVTGSVLAGISPRSIISGLNIYYTLIRLFAIPLAVLGILMLCGAPALLTASIVMALAMPAAAATVMLATLYGANAGYASQIIFLSTVVSMASIPLLGMFVNRVLGL